LNSYRAFQELQKRDFMSEDEKLEQKNLEIMRRLYANRFKKDENETPEPIQQENQPEN
jgi:hypothetical protein